MLYNYFFDSGQEDYSFGELLPMAVIGVIGGLLGNFLLTSLHTLLTTWQHFFIWFALILLPFTRCVIQSAYSSYNLLATELSA